MILALLGLTSSLPAGVLTVANTDDSGPGSLRQALADAQAGDTVSFGVTGTIVLTSGELTIDKNLSLEGPGPANLTLDGNDSDRILNVTAGTVGISGLTFTRGFAGINPPSIQSGGAIKNLGTLTVTGCEFIDNVAYGMGGAIGNIATLTLNSSLVSNSVAISGGGLYNATAATLVVNASTITGNTGDADGDGGGIENFGSLVIQDSSLLNNTAPRGSGGGIYVGAECSAEIRRCVISGNSAPYSSECLGGGVAVESLSTVTISDTTLAGNYAIRGGALSVWGGTVILTGSTLTSNMTFRAGCGIYQVSSVLNVTNTTFFANTSTMGGQGGALASFASGAVSLTSCTVYANYDAAGGGLYHDSLSSGSLTIRNCIVAGNGGWVGPDCSGTIISDDFNLIQNTTDCTITGTTTHNLIGVDPLLGPLQDNGGPTSTHALLPGSPARDAGHSSDTTTDQRDRPRPVDLPAVANAAGGDGSDIGAYETPATVASRFVFYNQSAFDDDDPAASADDDLAIATDKTALLPGVKAAFANYTSFTRGLNGVMVDIAGLPGTPTTADFTFKVGNTATPDTWSAGPAPSSITVRAGAGAGGADRITLIWANNAIQKQWLQVTVKGTANTGLATDDVFYFGHITAETGTTSTSAALVTSVDLAQTRASVTALTVPVTSRFDYNRDAKITSVDLAICRASVSASGLLLLDAPPLTPAPTLAVTGSTEARREQTAFVQRVFAADAAVTSGSSLRLLELIASTNAAVKLRFCGPSDRRYRVETTSAVGQPWRMLAPAPTPLDAPGQFEWEDPATDAERGACRFYRIRAE